MFEKVTKKQFRDKLHSHIEDLRAGKSFLIDDLLIYGRIVNPETGEISPAPTFEEKERAQPAKVGAVNAQAKNGIVDKPISDEEIKNMKLEGKMPLGLNEYIDENSGTLEKHSCSICGTSKTEIRECPEEFTVCEMCCYTPDWEKSKRLQSVSEITNSLPSGSGGSGKNGNNFLVLNKQTACDGKVRAMPKPIPKKKK